MLRTLVVALSLAASLPCVADVGDEAARSYTLETSGTTSHVKVGAPGKVVLWIRPRGGTHVHPQAPLALSLQAPPALKLAREKLGHRDAVDPKSEAPRFEIPVTASAAGAYSVQASVDFFLCSDTWCVKQVRSISIPITAK